MFSSVQSLAHVIDKSIDGVIKCLGELVQELPEDIMDEEFAEANATYNSDTVPSFLKEQEV